MKIVKYNGTFRVLSKENYYVYIANGRWGKWNSIGIEKWESIEDILEAFSTSDLKYGISQVQLECELNELMGKPCYELIHDFVRPEHLSEWYPEYFI